MAENKRKRWTREETLLFLSCYAGRKDEFVHARKKKYAYTNVLEDMVSQGFSDMSVTPAALENKLRTLLNAYKCAKDNTRQTGAAPCVVPYMTQLDELFGRQPIISNTNCLNLGQVASPLHQTVELEQEMASSSRVPTTVEVEQEMPSTSRVLTSLANTAPSSSNIRKRKTAKERYYEEKLKLKKTFYEDLKNIVNRRLEEKNKVENEKLELLKVALQKNA